MQEAGVKLMGLTSFDYKIEISGLSQEIIHVLVLMGGGIFLVFLGFSTIASYAGFFGFFIGLIMLTVGALGVYVSKDSVTTLLIEFPE
jgi:hypothetical protein